MSTEPAARPLSSIAKRLMDVAFATTALVIAAPVIGLAAVLIRLEDGGPVMFWQERAGLRGRPFRVAKLRSMRTDVPPPEVVGQVVAGNAYLTRVGTWIRRLKVDELPQVWHVVTGEMSLVGPRPALVRHARAYSPEQARRLTVRPGLTGWAQVNGNTRLSWDDRIALDLWYLRHWSMRLDLWILVRTVDVLVRGEHVSERALARARES